jgi:hypothetical protein
MRDTIKHFPVNWINGMKISKDHFIAQDDAWKDALNDVTALNVSPIRFGVLPSSVAGEKTFDVRTSFDNQKNLRVTVHACNAITSGGVRIILPSLPHQNQVDGAPATSLQLTATATDVQWWIVLTVNPFERQPAGVPDREATPVRFPNVLPVYKVMVVSDNQFTQYYNNPYALTIGKIICVNNEVVVDNMYIPPCYSVNAHEDMRTLYSEVDTFLAALETRCSQVVQKIYTRKQQNEISEQVMFVFDRIMLYLGQTITSYRWEGIHASPATMLG